MEWQGYYSTETCGKKQISFDMLFNLEEEIRVYNIEPVYDKRSVEN